MAERTTAVCWTTATPHPTVIKAPLPVAQQHAGTTYYVFSSPPVPIWGRPKYRNNVPRPRGVHDYYNVMWDPHVRRGDPLRRHKEKTDMEKCLKIKTQKRKAAKTDNRGQTPPPVDGRKHCELQTERYLEDLEADILEFDVKTQTVPLHELPVTPWFTPSKMGEDVGTQILPGELFNFDEEVQPVIETLVGKVIEQALLECMEEEELLCLRDQQMAFEERRRQEQVRLFRLQERERLVDEERERLMAEMKRQQEDEQQLEDRVGAQVFASLYLGRATGHAIDTLRREGFLNTKAIITNSFLPWLNCQVEHVLGHENLSRSILDDIIRYTTLKREAEYARGAWTPPPPTPVDLDLYEHVGEGGG